MSSSGMNLFGASTTAGAHLSSVTTPAAATMHTNTDTNKRRKNEFASIETHVDESEDQQQPTERRKASPEELAKRHIVRPRHSHKAKSMPPPALKTDPAQKSLFASASDGVPEAASEDVALQSKAEVKGIPGNTDNGPGKSTVQDTQEEPNTHKEPIKDLASADFWRLQVEAVYRKRNPKKLEEPNYLSGLMKKYAGREQILYVSLCKNYSLDPRKFYTQEEGEDEDLHSSARDDEGGPEAPSSVTSTKASGAPLNLTLGTQSTGSIFGAQPTGSIFGSGLKFGESIPSSAGSFGGNPFGATATSGTSNSIFGTSNSLFGASTQSAAGSGGNLFLPGGTSAPFGTQSSSPTGTFFGVATTGGATGLFSPATTSLSEKGGNLGVAGKTGGSIFGNLPMSAGPQTSGGEAERSNSTGGFSSIFPSTADGTSGSLFGSTNGLFASMQTAPATSSIFGAAPIGNVFGGSVGSAGGLFGGVQTSSNADSPFGVSTSAGMVNPFTTGQADSGNSQTSLPTAGRKRRHTPM